MLLRPTVYIASTLLPTMADKINNASLPYGLGLSIEDHIKKHLPSGEWNHLVASIVHAHKDGRTFCKPDGSTPFDIDVCVLTSAVKEGEAEEKKFLTNLQKTKEELKSLAINSSDSEHEEKEEEESEEDEEAPTSDLKGIREKTGKAPKWLQSMNSKKEKALEAKKRKSLLSSIKTQEETLAGIRAKLFADKESLVKKEALQRYNLLLSRALRGAERSYKETKDLDYLVKNVHYNMALWETKSKPLLPPPKMVQRLVGSPGAFRTIMVPDNERPIIPLEEYLREDW